MSLLEGTLNLGRAMSAQRLTETVVVGVFDMGTDPATGDPIEVLTSQSYSGPGQIVYGTLTVSDHDAPAQPAGVQSPYLKLPSGTVVARGQEVRVTASRADSALVGLKFTIDGRGQSGQTTTVRYPLIEAS
ncbi:DUF6093 family protein [Microbacterium jejuense]|uniref:DUF6093 family protein n=1 Tax=Microbacterium jejuense TaxID=1263637 RepID=UPI0031EB74DC